MMNDTSGMKKNHRLTLTLLLIGLALAACLLAWLRPAWLGMQPTVANLDVSPTTEVLPVQPKGIGDNFTLLQGKQEVSLHDFLGKVVVIYFGYASCPDVCPTTLGVISSALKSLSSDELAQIQPIFISVDPARDNGDNLMAYARHFHPSFVGLTGSPEQVKQVADQYHTYFANMETKSYLGYLIHHTSKTYVISKDGKSVTILPASMSKPDLVNSLREAL